MQTGELLKESRNQVGEKVNTHMYILTQRQKNRGMQNNTRRDTYSHSEQCAIFEEWVGVRVTSDLPCCFSTGFSSFFSLDIMQMSKKTGCNTVGDNTFNCALEEVVRTTVVSSA